MTSLAPAELDTELFWVQTCLQPEKPHILPFTPNNWNPTHNIIQQVNYTRGITMEGRRNQQKWYNLCCTIFSHTFYFCMANPEVHFAKSPNPIVVCSLSHPVPESFPRLTFCMLSRTSEVLMLPSANLNLSRLATDSSPAFGLMGGTGSPNKKIPVSLVVRLGFGFWQFHKLAITKNQIWLKHNLFSSSEVHSKCNFPEVPPIVSIYLKFSVEY